MTVFTNYEFFFRFFPIFLLLYYLLPKRLQNLLLFIGSMVFYAFGQLVYLPILLGLTVFNYYIGIHSFNCKNNSSAELDRRTALVLSVAVDAFALILFKILAQAVSDIALPLGISFYVFKMISFQIDIYRGLIKKKPSFIVVAAYFSLFPQITQGPIMRFHEKTMTTPRKFSFKKIEQGLTYFLLGMSMKVLLADRLSILWNEISKIGYESISPALAWMGAYGYTFQLYFDFWGYSLMSSGLLMMLGFPFVENFHHPYSSDSIAVFYRDWHMTLGSWFRDYIYIPLGGSRVKRGMVIRNLMIVWSITGIWHGGTINFLIWGLVLGLIIVMERFVINDYMKRLPIIGRLEVLIIIPLTWVVFAISDLKELGIYFARLFPIFGVGQTARADDFAKFFGTYWIFFLGGLILMIPRVYILLTEEKKGVIRYPAKLLIFISFLVSLYFVSNGSSNPFLYFSF